ncbi:hypothetical protein PBRA_007259 [Plasmodiophora brassicae]|uniref:Uncharacterized protein n=1 Tax=Plasmodiophora brassicae TaxID=37360 RepID=A0A0G4IWR1_PLABS|nr:hypothetical protein PBRA_007259 [Plasmodiophora brassicae]
MVASVSARILLGTAAVHAILSLLAVTVLPSVVTAFALSPANSVFVHFYLWTVVTYPLVDRNLALVKRNVLWTTRRKADIIARRQLTFSFYFQRGDTSKGISKSQRSRSCGVAIFWIEMSLFVFSRWEDFLFHSFCGLSGISATFIVALKLIKGKEPVTTAFPAFKFNHLPFTIFIIAAGMFMLGGLLAKELLPVVFGIYFSWLYIRFYRIDPDTNLVGNVSVDFQLDSLFPEPIRPALAAMFAVTFKIAVLLGFFKTYLKQNHGFLVGAVSPASSPTKVASPSTSMQVVVEPDPSDRRKRLAMQAVEEQLALKAKTASQESRARSASPLRQPTKTSPSRQPIHSSDQ